MKVTPLELRQRQFTTVMRGYDRAEVNTFLAQAADDFEALMLETDRLRQEAGKAEAALNEHRGQEKQLSNTLLTAQKIADDIREKAQHDAARFISEAEGRIAMMVEKSLSRVGEVQREIEALRVKRREVEISLEGLVVTLNKTLENVRDRDTQHEERTSLLLPSDRRVEKPSVVLPLRDPSSSGTNITPAVSSPSSSPLGPPPAMPGPSVVLASAPATPSTPSVTSSATSPTATTTSSSSSATPPVAPATSAASSGAVPATPSLLKPASVTPPSATPSSASGPSTPPAAGTSAPASRPSVEPPTIRP
jgi:cell division initiation protein